MVQSPETFSTTLTGHRNSTSLGAMLSRLISAPSYVLPECTMGLAFLKASFAPVSTLPVPKPLGLDTSAARFLVGVSVA